MVTRRVKKVSRSQNRKKVTQRSAKISVSSPRKTIGVTKRTGSTQRTVATSTTRKATKRRIQTGEGWKREIMRKLNEGKKLWG